MASTLEETVARAAAGDQAALETVIERIQPRIYGLAVRMLWHPEDARDAAQEILIRIITHLGDFRGESAFMTWAYRVAANYLNTVRKSRIEEQNYTFERFGDELEEGLSDSSLSDESEAEHNSLLAEIRIGCTLGMLLCLDRAHRLAYILGEILELEGPEAAEVLAIAPDVFRKRLSPGREAIVAFTKAKCGLVNPQNPCRCHRRVSGALAMKRIDRGKLLFAHDAEEAARFPKVLAAIRTLQDTQRVAAVYRAHAEFSSLDLTSRLKGLVEKNLVF
jgi:RNA polymerase sigma factor (sigma-70 family)